MFENNQTKLKKQIEEVIQKVNLKNKSSAAMRIVRLARTNRLTVNLLAISLSLFVGVMLIGSSNHFPSGIKLISNQAITFGSASHAPNLDFSDFGRVEKFEVPNAKKTVIYIPQIHKEPTLDMSDPKNDQAVVVQTEIYSMLDKLVSNHNITNVMDETDLYGPMPKDKVEKVKSGLAQSAKFRSDVKNVLAHYVKDGGSQETADAIQNSANDIADKFERNIYLTGGAAVLEAKNPEANVYGSQNAKTINEARVELQKIVYMEQRISQLQGGQNQGTTSTQAQSGTGNNAQIQNMLSQLGKSSTSKQTATLDPVKNFAKEKGDTALENEANDISVSSKQLSSGKSYETGSSVSSAQAGANVNPYANETNLKKLQSEYDQTYAKFMKIAKDQRSQEVADNIERQMDENHVDNAVLVFGAQHKDQIVSALNQKGISVIVITPDSES